MELVILCGFAFLAGFIDSIVGGGGLIQLPALLAILPQAPVVLMLGTNKVASCMGTSVATYQYARQIPLPWKDLLPAAVVAFALSFTGARVVSLIDATSLRPLIILLLIAILIYVSIRKDFGSVQALKGTALQRRWLGILFAGVIGFYDGFFGPGTGSFLIFAFIGILGMNFITASASSKVINLATNLAAIVYFAATGNINFMLAIPMGFFNIMGAVAGTRMAMLKGSKFVRVLFIVVVCGIILKLIYDLLTAVH
ncbi:MAG TPA: TSUP family transporter [Anaerolineaceae bacterium]|nr:TSUP family transporter [Anaerolineaceae bacterium]HPN53753.1 TSUP family transporter [Anaerolineaceae bacterium]